MQDVTSSPPSEQQFAALVDAIAADPDRHEQLTDLLREEHALYDQRGAAAISRMRGWVLLALARSGVSDAALLFVLEELDTGINAYLVAAAARALRAYPRPTAVLAPFVMRALTNIRFHDEPVSFDNYGEYAVSSSNTSAVRELLATLAWLGPLARAVLPEVESLRSPGLAKKLHRDLDQALGAIRRADCSAEIGGSCCTLPSGLRNASLWARGSRAACQPIGRTRFEDHEGKSITFIEFFRGQPSIVVFFYTRCDNPLKCSLTVTKLARIQKLLEARGLADQIHTAAITYDPAYDLPDRLRRYGQNRGLRLDDRHRMLRAIGGVGALRRHFKLGVNFIESLVNRHRIEAYVLDSEGGIAASFQRIHWEEQQIVDRVAEVLKEEKQESDSALRVSSAKAGRSARRSIASTLFGVFAALGVAFFPKCPVCWAAYFSWFGIASLEQVPYSPWLQAVLGAVMLANLASVWVRARSTGRMPGFYLVSAGASAIIVSKIAWADAAGWGVVLTLAGSLLSVLSGNKPSRRAKLIIGQ